MAVSDLPDHIVTAFLSLVSKGGADARQGSNLLVYWASAHYDNREEVLRCTTVIRALGYMALADKLEIDRSEVVWYDVLSDIHVFVPKKLARDIVEIPGASQLWDTNGERETKGARDGWKVPQDQEDFLLCLLGVHLGGKIMCGSRGVQVIRHRKKEEALQYLKPSSPIETLVADRGLIRVTKTNGALHVQTPYNQTYVESLKAQIPYTDRRWDPSLRCWVINESRLEVVRGLIFQVWHEMI
jgi:hypothetical protein